MVMPRNAYAEINLHMTWHTKGNAPVLVETVEDRLHRYLKHRCLQTEGVVVHEINGTPDHVHLAVSIPPAVCVSEWIGELKGASAHYINHEICNRRVLTQVEHPGPIFDFFVGVKRAWRGRQRG
jgi:putative transposase